MNKWPIFNTNKINKSNVNILIENIQAVGDEYTNWNPDINKLYQFHLLYFKCSSDEDIKREDMLNIYLYAMNIEGVDDQPERVEEYAKWLYRTVISCNNFSQFTEKVLQNLLWHLKDIHDHSVQESNNLATITEMDSNNKHKTFQHGYSPNQTKKKLPQNASDDDTTCKCSMM